MSFFETFCLDNWSDWIGLRIQLMCLQLSDQIPYASGNNQGDTISSPGPHFPGALINSHTALHYICWLWDIEASHQQHKLSAVLAAKYINRRAIISFLSSPESMKSFPLLMFLSGSKDVGQFLEEGNCFGGNCVGKLCVSCRPYEGWVNLYITTISLNIQKDTEAKNYSWHGLLLANFLHNEQRKRVASFLGTSFIITLSRDLQVMLSLVPGWKIQHLISLLSLILATIFTAV